MAIIFRDTFEDADGTNISAHVPTPDGGSAWTVTISGAGTSGTISTAAPVLSGASSAKLVVAGNLNNPIVRLTRVIPAQSGTNTVFQRLRKSGTNHNNQYIEFILRDDAATPTKIGPGLLIYGLRIKYLNNIASTPTVVDSGLDIVADTNYYWKIIFNDAAKTYTAWIIGGAFVNWTQLGGTLNFYAANTWGGSHIGDIITHAYFNGNGSVAFTVWFDDIQVGIPTEGVVISDMWEEHAIDFTSKESMLAPIPEADIIVDNTQGEYVNEFEIFEDVKLWSQDVQQFRGRIVDIRPENQDEGDIIRLVARGYIDELMTQVVEAYAAKSRSYMVINLVTKYAPDLTTTNVTTTTESLTRSFKGVTALAAIMELADELGYEVYVDFDNDLHFSLRNVQSSGETITESDLTGKTAQFPQRGQDVINQATVYGDPLLSPQPCALVEDLESQNYYGTPGKVNVRGQMIVDKRLQTTDECEATGQKIIAQGAWRMDGAYLSALYYETLQVGKLVHLSIDSRSYVGDMLVLEKSYNYLSATSTLRLAYYDSIISRHLGDMLKTLRKLVGYNIGDNAIVTKIVNFYENFSMSITGTMTVTNEGDSFLAGHPTHGVLGNGQKLAGNQNITRTEVTLE